MFKTALVGIDLSPTEKPLIGSLPELRRWGIGAIVLAHVIRLGYIEGAGLGHEDWYRTWLEERAAPLREAGFEVATSVSASGVPAEELLAVARNHKVDLLVVGSRSHSVLHDLFLGSVTRDLIHKSDIPVLIERIEPTEAGTAEACAAVRDVKQDRILLATDFSGHARSAEYVAIRLASQVPEIDCLTVLPTETSEEANAERNAAASKLHGLIARIDARGGKGSARIEQGDPADVIARIGQEGYSLIIVGKHGRNWIVDRIIGSTAARVCEIGKRPGLMVPLQEE